MSLVRWDPFRELQDMTDRLNKALGNPTISRPTGETGKDALMGFDWAPSVDIAETAAEFLVKAELPEVNKEDVKVTVDKGLLRIEGERKQEKEEKGKKFHRIERSYGSFLRTFTLPENIDETKVVADFKDGVLSVRLPKMEKAKPKSIEVKVG